MAAFGSFVPFGLVAFFATGDRAGLFAAAFGLLPFLYMPYRVLARRSGYAIGPEGVLLKRGRSR